MKKHYYYSQNQLYYNLENLFLKQYSNIILFNGLI